MHFPSVDSARPIADDQLVVRYMKIATFLMLLRGLVFIPSLKTLQRTDPSESGVLSWMYRTGEVSTSPQDYIWFCSKADDMERRMLGISDKVTLPETIVNGIWLRELALRRCIWCWYAERPESMGMWNNYGPHGIAIVSKVKHVRDALSLPDDALSSVGRVIYLPVKGRERIHTPDDHVVLSDRPYYFKQEAYKYENEIRFVVACEPITTGFKGGILLRVNPKKLIEQVLISPHILEDEAYALQALISKDFSMLPRETIKVSSLLYPGDPSLRDIMREYLEPEKADPIFLQSGRDSLSGFHQEKDADARPLPKIMRKV